MLSMKGKYALQALLYLAEIGGGRRAQVGEISDAKRIPHRYLGTILADLGKRGYVIARKGPNGGYSLARPAKDIIVGRIIRVMDGPLSPIACASRSTYMPCEGCDVTTCQVRSLMVQVRQAICDVLDNCSLEALRFSDIGSPDLVDSLNDNRGVHLDRRRTSAPE